jgi:hypothetical protein
MHHVEKEGHSRREKSPSSPPTSKSRAKKEEKEEKCELVKLLTMDGKKYFMSRSTLSQAKYFKALFSENWSSQDDAKTIHLVGKSLCLSFTDVI